MCCLQKLSPSNAFNRKSHIPMFLWYKRSVPLLCSIQIISNGPPSERQGNGFASSWFEPQRLRHYKSSHVPLSGTLNACPMYPSFCAVTLSTQLHIPLAKTKCPQNDWVEDKCWRVSKKHPTLAVRVASCEKYYLFVHPKNSSWILLDIRFLPPTDMSFNSQTTSNAGGSL